ncbi:leucine zipper domain-containing protein [Bradyrhizobium sp. 33ap4]|uniref:leucine zipper domain-containing protein n=1 Tax=Bradyrhizobium sp. 33ap4 TaxID=3061630 RepID=UPI00292D5080|nr:leucine zipper domain-containing protein [Bradyrhizobium sp. 33ap4]
MDIKHEQRANVKFCVKLEKSATETFEMIRQAYGDESVSRTTCFEWHARFRSDRASLNDDARSGRPSTSSTAETVEKIKGLVHEDRRVTIREVADMADVSFGTAQAILTCNLNMRRVAAKFVPRLLPRPPPGDKG